MTILKTLSILPQIERIICNNELYISAMLWLAAYHIPKVTVELEITSLLALWLRTSNNFNNLLRIQYDYLALKTYIYRRRGCSCLRFLPLIIIVTQFFMLKIRLEGIHLYSKRDLEMFIYCHLKLYLSIVTVACCRICDRSFFNHLF